MKLSNLLRWGGRDEGGTATAEPPAKSPKSSGSSSFWGMGKKETTATSDAEPEAAPTPLLDGYARLDWTVDGEPRHKSLVEFTGGRGRLAADGSLEPYASLWVTPQGGRPLAAKLISLEEEGAAVRIEVSLDCPETDHGGDGRVVLKQIDSQGAVRAENVRIRASETAGRIAFASATSAVPGSLVLLEAETYGCLGVVRESEDGDHTEIETVMQARPLQAAA